MTSMLLAGVLGATVVGRCAAVVVGRAFAVSDRSGSTAPSPVRAAIADPAIHHFLALRPLPLHHFLAVSNLVGDGGSEGKFIRNLWLRPLGPGVCVRQQQPVGWSPLQTSAGALSRTVGSTNLIQPTVITRDSATAHEWTKRPTRLVPTIPRLDGIVCDHKRRVQRPPRNSAVRSSDGTWRAVASST